MVRFFFPTSRLLMEYETHDYLVQDGEPIQIEAIAAFLVIFGARMNFVIFSFSK